MSSVDQINSLLRGDTIDLSALEAALDAADHATRLAATRKWSGRLQSKLFDSAEGRAVRTSQVLPTDEIGREVIHHGTNTLPAFRTFQKRFAWVETPDGRQIAGYNHNPSIVMATTGPGYYVAYEDPDGPEFVIDYHQLPVDKPDSWPAIVPNNRRLGHFVYAGMVDRLRRVSEHVTIGRAYKKKPMSAWFVLVRQDL